MSGSSAGRKRAASFLGGPSPEFQRLKKQRAPQTCEWLLLDPLYKAWSEWNQSAAPTLWIHGPAGIGKSYLAQFALDNLAQSDGKSAILSHFCDATSTPSSVLRGLLAQLKDSPRASRDLHDSILQVVSPSSPTTANAQSGDGFKILDNFATIAERGPPLTIVIDGLDELPDQYLRPQEFGFPSRLVELTTALASNVRVLIFSRTNASIKQALGDSPQIQVTADQVQDDIDKFIDFELERHESLAPLRPGLKDQLVQQADGIFLWASLSVQALAREPHADRVLDRLQNLPASLDDVYAAALSKQSRWTEDQIMLRDILLRWMTFTLRPLRTVEIANAIAIETLAFIPDLETKATEVCGSLVKIENGILKPIHHSLRDFMLGESAASSVKSLHPSDANLCIAKVLLSYLSSSQLLDVSQANQSFQETHPLAEYATLYWVYHASRSAPDADLQQQIELFFSGPQATVWIDRLMPAFLSQSVLPVPPRLPINARFFHLSMLKSQIARYFGPEKKQEIDELISTRLRSAYEGFLASTRNEGSPLTLKRLLELGELYSWIPSHEKQARGILEEAVELSSRLESPDAGELQVSARQALADDLKRDGKYEEAQIVLEKALEIATTALPNTDIKLMFLHDSLGWVYMRRGRLDEAATHLQKALDVAAASFGSRSPFTLRSKVTLAEVLGKLGRHAEAEALCEALKAQLKQHRQSGVPLPKDSVSQLYTLAAIYMQEGKYDEARETFQVVADDRRGIFGDEHRLTLGADMQLGIAMRKAGDAAGALVLLQGLLPKQTKVLGPAHQDVMDVQAMIEEMAA